MAWTRKEQNKEQEEHQAPAQPLPPMDFPFWDGWECPAGTAGPFPAGRWDLQLQVTFGVSSVPSLQGTDTFPSFHCRLPGWDHGRHGHLPAGHGPCPHGRHPQGDVSAPCKTFWGFYKALTGFFKLALLPVFGVISCGESLVE